MANSMKVSGPVANKCRNFSNGNRVTLQHAQVKADPVQAVVAQVKADPVQAVAALVKVAALDKADPMPAVAVQVVLTAKQCGLPCSRSSTKTGTDS
jgi:hypothetical protein